MRGKRLLGWKFEDKVLELRDLRVGGLGVLVVKLAEEKSWKGVLGEMAMG